jgi:hypothetical protein
MFNSEFVQRIKATPNAIEFDKVMAYIDEHYEYTPARFTNGVEGDMVVNEEGYNEGSCKIFAFAKLVGLSERDTLACFGKYYTVDVLGNPNGDDHANIRTFMRHGWKGIRFDKAALTEKELEEA